MRIALLYFSPSGSTEKVARLLAGEFAARKQDVQVIAVSGNERFFLHKDISGFLLHTVQPHDVLFIGAPVYAHHLQYHAADLLLSLPAPDAAWGRYAVPYVTYGGVSSGVALAEAARLLKRSGRIVHAGMKVSAPHAMTRAFMDEEFNRNALRDGALPEAAELADRVMELDNACGGACHARHLHYNGVRTALKARFLFNERLWHEKRYPGVEIDEALCRNCGACVSVCPVLRLRGDERAVRADGPSTCIHCFNCVSACPAGAVRLKGDPARGRAFMAKMLAKHGHKEQPATAVYPLKKERRGSGA